MKITRPDSLTEAAKLISAGGVAVAGGSGFQLEFSQGQTPPAQYVPIGHLIPKGIQGFTIGAGTPLEDIRHANIPLLSKACADVAGAEHSALGHFGWQSGVGQRVSYSGADCFGRCC